MGQKVDKVMKRNLISFFVLLLASSQTLLGVCYMDSSCESTIATKLMETQKELDDGLSEVDRALESLKKAYKLNNNELDMEIARLEAILALEVYINKQVDEVAHNAYVLKEKGDREMMYQIIEEALKEYEE
jgi:tetratricopeptide (TPR) repeat protein